MARTVYGVRCALKILIPTRARSHLQALLARLRRRWYSWLLRGLEFSALARKLARRTGRLSTEVRRFSSIRVLREDFPSRVHLQWSRPQQLLYSPPRFAVSERSQLLRAGQQSAQIGAIVEGAVVSGGSSAALVGEDRLLFDCYHRTGGRLWYTDRLVLSSRGEKCLVSGRRPRREADAALFLGANYCANYYHVVYEVLIRLYQVLEAGLAPGFPIVLDSVIRKVPQFAELLGLLNTEGRTLAFIERDERWRVNRLFYFEFPNVIPPNYRDWRDVREDDCLFDGEAVVGLRGRLLAGLKNQGRVRNGLPRRVFIGRKEAGARAFNQRDVFDRLRPLGFSWVNPECLSMSEQIQLFRNAEVIVGGSGAAFTSILFCSEGCKVLILTNYPFRWCLFSTVAKLVRADLVYVAERGRVVSARSSAHDRYRIDPRDVVFALRAWGVRA